MDKPHQNHFGKTHIDVRREKTAEVDRKAPKRTRPTRRLQKEMVERFREKTDLALSRLVGILEDESADLTHVIAAAKEVLNRGWGAVPQQHVIAALFQHQQIINVDALHQIPTDQLTQLESTLARLVQPVEDAEILDEGGPPT